VGQAHRIVVLLLLEIIVLFLELGRVALSLKADRVPDQVQPIAPIQSIVHDPLMAPLLPLALETRPVAAQWMRAELARGTECRLEPVHRPEDWRQELGPQPAVAVLEPLTGVHLTLLPCVPRPGDMDTIT